MQRHRAAIRTTVWLGLAVLAATRVVLAALPLEPLRELVLTDALTYLLPMLLVAGAGLWLARQLSGIERRFWGLMFLSCLSLFIAEAYWTWYVVNVDPRGPSLSGPVKWFNVLAALFIIALIVTLTRTGERPFIVRARVYLDVVGAMFAAYPLVYLLWTLPALEGLPNQVMNAGWAALWPIFGVTMFAGIFAVISGSKAFGWRPWERLVLVSTGIFALGLCSFPLWYPDLLVRTAVEVGWYGLVLGSGLYLMFVAAVYRMTASDAEALTARRPVSSWRHRSLSEVYPAVLTLALLLSAREAYQFADSGVAAPLVASTAVLAVLVTARSWVAGYELSKRRVAAITDPASGAYNARYLHGRLDRLVREASEGSEISVAIVRVHDFTRLDSVHGLGASERSIKSLVDAAARLIGPYRETYRTAADEIALVFYNCPLSSARGFAEGLCRHVDARPITQGVPFMVSSGVAAFPSHALESEALLASARAAADAARFGQHRVRVFEPGCEHAELADAESGARRRSLRESLKSLALAVDGRIPETSRHSIHVAELAAQLGRRSGMAPAEIELLRFTALVHDVGKVGLPDGELIVEGPRDSLGGSADTHVTLGARLASASQLQRVAALIEVHHERRDGSGYPRGLEGDAIPALGSVLGLSDEFVALTEGRAGRAGLSCEEAVEELRGSPAGRFEAQLLQALSELIAENPDGWRDVGIETSDLIAEASA